MPSLRLRLTQSTGEQNGQIRKELHANEQQHKSKKTKGKVNQ
jgi:hypothetical protein